MNQKIKKIIEKETIKWNKKHPNKKTINTPSKPKWLCPHCKKPLPIKPAKNKPIICFNKKMKK